MQKFKNKVKVFFSDEDLIDRAIYYENEKLVQIVTEKRLDDLKTSSELLQISLTSQGRCPICTLKIPCKHYLKSPAPLPLHLSNLNSKISNQPSRSNRAIHPPFQMLHPHPPQSPMPPTVSISPVPPLSPAPLSPYPPSQSPKPASTIEDPCKALRSSLQKLYKNPKETKKKLEMQEHIQQYKEKKLESELASAQAAEKEKLLEKCRQKSQELKRRRYFDRQKEKIRKFKEQKQSKSQKSSSCKSSRFKFPHNLKLYQYQMDEIESILQTHTHYLSN